MTKDDLSKEEKDRIIHDIYQDSFKDTKSTLLGNTLTFPPLWLLFDYLIGEPNYIFNFKRNFIVPAVAMIFFVFLNRNKDTKKYMLFWSATFTVVNTYLLLITTYAQFKLPYTLGLLCGPIFYFLMIVSEARYFFPALLMVIILPPFFRENFETHSSFPFISFYFFVVFTHLFAFIGIYYRFKTLLKNKWQEHLIEDQRAKLLASNQLNRSLIRVVSHDIVNELQINVGTVHMIQKKLKADIGEEELKELLNQKLDNINKASLTALNIVTSLRDWEAVRSGKVSMTLESLCLKDVLDSSLYLYQDKLLKKEITMEYTGDPSLKFISDPQIFKDHIFKNILTNAIKFTPKGKTITFDCQKIESNVCISCIDEGIGIPNHMIVDLFDPYKPTERQGTEGEKGTGFGLPVVKEYVELLGGKIKVESQLSKVNHGTTFSVSFPSAKI